MNLGGVSLNPSKIRTAARNGRVDILDIEYAKCVQNFNCFKGRCDKLLGDAIRAGHFHILRWFAEKGLMCWVDAIEPLFLAIESDNQEIINFLLLERIYLVDDDPDGRMTLEECLRKRQSSFHVHFITKAAKVGNMNAVRQFLGINLQINPYNIGGALVAAAKNGHIEIADLLVDLIVKIVQLRTKNIPLNKYEAEKLLVSAVEAKYQTLIDLLLHEEIYRDPDDSKNRLNYEQMFVNDQLFDHKKVLIKAAKVGNMNVVEYYLSHGFVTRRKSLKKAKKIAKKNNHSKISELIGTFLMF